MKTSAPQNASIAASRCLCLRRGKSLLKAGQPGCRHQLTSAAGRRHTSSVKTSVEMQQVSLVAMPTRPHHEGLRSASSRQAALTAAKVRLGSGSVQNSHAGGRAPLDSTLTSSSASAATSSCSNSSKSFN